MVILNDWILKLTKQGNAMKTNSSVERKFNNNGVIEPCQGTDEIDELSMLKIQYADLQQRFDVIEQEFKIQSSLYMKAIDNSTFISMLRNSNDYSTWFRMLSEACNRFLVVLVVKDTPGDNMPSFVYKSVIESGFSEIRKDLWNTYVGVIYQNSVWCNDRHANEEKTSYLYESLDKKFRLSAYSEAWRNGNRGEISINGTQLAVNIRGLNIVIYDLNDNQLVDSIGFDSHECDNFIFKR